MRSWIRLVPAVALIGLAACGDGETNDRRGYTKAPLERPGVTIRAESRSAMDRMGAPIRPMGEPITVPADSTAG